MVAAVVGGDPTEFELAVLLPAPALEDDMDRPAMLTGGAQHAVQSVHAEAKGNLVGVSGTADPARKRSLSMTAAKMVIGIASIRRFRFIMEAFAQRTVGHEDHERGPLLLRMSCSCSTTASCPHSPNLNFRMVGTAVAT